MKKILAGLRRDQLQKIADDTRNDKRRVAQVVHKMVVDALAVNSYEQSNGDAMSPVPTNSKGVPQMTKKLLTATFSDGDQITRKTSIAYGFAWRAFGHDSKGNKHTWSGFSATRTNAERAANAGLGRFTHNPCGREVVEVVATVPTKKVNPAKAAPWRIVETSAGGNKRFVIGDRGAHLRFASRDEAVAKALDIKTEHDARCNRMPGLVRCTYEPVLK